MPGYQLVETKNLAPGKANGIVSHDQKIGFLDFLREIQEDPLPFKKFFQVQVSGLEEVLFAARDYRGDLALRIHQILRSAASDLERRLIEVQVVFQGKLVRGDDLWVVYRNQRLPVGHIFGSPIRQTDSRGNPFFRTNFNLTNG